MTAQSVVIIGAGGFGREVADVVEAINSAGFGDLELKGFVDDAPAADNLEQLARRGYRHLGTLEDYLDRERSAAYVIGIASASVRRATDIKLRAAGHEAVSLVHPTATLGSNVTIGPGSVVCAGARITTNVALGRHVHVNLNVTIGHEARLSSFATLFPGSAVSGNCVLEESCTLGAGSIVLPGITVGEQAFVGAGAVVTRNVPQAVVVKGMPAR